MFIEMGGVEICVSIQWNVFEKCLTNKQIMFACLGGVSLEQSLYKSQKKW